MFRETQWRRRYPFYTESMTDTEPVEEEEDDD